MKFDEILTHIKEAFSSKKNLPFLSFKEAEITFVTQHGEKIYWVIKEPYDHKIEKGFRKFWKAASVNSDINAVPIRGSFYEEFYEEEKDEK
jgi:hypothetical protein